MINLRIDLTSLAKARKKLDAYANRKFRATVYYMYEEMLLVAAQFSGDYVSNFSIITQNDGYPQYHESPEKAAMDRLYGAPHQAGDAPAVLANRASMARKPFTYRDKVYFVNPTPLFFTATTVTGRDGVTRPLRPENVIPGQVTIKQFMRSQFGSQL